MPYFTADRALRTLGGAKKGENLLIHGASGGVGLAAIQIAKFLGLNVVGTAGSADGIKLIESFGIKGNIVFFITYNKVFIKHIIIDLKIILRKCGKTRNLSISSSKCLQISIYKMI